MRIRGREGEQEFSTDADRDPLSHRRKAFVAREAARGEAAEDAEVDALIAGFARGNEVGNGVPVAARVAKTAVPAAVAKRGNREPRSAASRETARKRMVAWWAARRSGGRTKAGAAPNEAPAAKKCGPPSAGRARQVAAMKAY